jgi:predicted acylesterase/phospholipase RssA
MRIDLTLPAAYPSTAKLTKENECDLVMKGGITSGVIYPLAVCQLAATRRLRNVGGTSAGAIAAAGAAAAEYGRDAGAGPDGRADVGYPRLASLPDKLAMTDGRHTTLFHLFQPQPVTRALYRLLSVWISGGGKGIRVFRSVIPAIGALLPLPALVGVGVPAALLIWAAISCSVWGIVLSAVLLIIGLVTAVLSSVVCRVLRNLPANQLGLCSGMAPPNSARPALTTWLADEFDAMAGLDEASAPLTFGLLKEKDIELAMLTTDLSTGTQNQLPFQSGVWAFKPQEFEELFPKRIVDHLVAHAPDASQGADFQRFWNEGYCPLPEPEDLPVIVAVRMSLSFPALLSSIPLYAIDYRVFENPVVRHRFSDGGITSNFPIHFFDSAVPSRPTFGINLVEVPEVYTDQERNVLLPPDTGDNMQAPTVEITSVPQFAKSLLNTLQNWADSMQTRVPGYRGRIVAVNHTKNEGGINLDMASTVVSALATRGQYAGKATDGFDFDNHRWLRFRSFLQTLDEIVKPAGPRLKQASVDGVTSYDDLIANPPSYRSPWSQQHEQVFRTAKAAMVSMSETFAAIGEEIEYDKDPIGHGAPDPQPRLQVRPRPIS